MRLDEHAYEVVFTDNTRQSFTGTSWTTRGDGRLLEITQASGKVLLLPTHNIFSFTEE